MKRLLCLLLTGALVSGLLCACTKQESYDYYLSFEVDGVPATLDPQLASAASELAVVTNIFEGLLQLDDKGTVQPGSAESYAVSEDGRTYTFHLKEDLCWRDEEKTPVTAEDFAFGLRRALLPETKCPLASLLYCIRNAKLVHEGELESEELGIRAENDRTLVLTLDYADPELPRTLTQSLCMPCHRDFFEQTGGKYGMDNDKILSNGPFYVRRWSKNTSSLSMRLTRSDAYYGHSKILPAAVLLYFNSEPKERVTMLTEDQRDAGYLSYELIADARANGLTVLSAEYANWSLYFCPDSPKNADDTMRRIFAQSVDRQQLEKFLKEDYVLSQRIAPSSYRIGTHTCGEYTPEQTFRIRETVSGNLADCYKQKLAELGADDEYTLLYCEDNEVLRNAARAVAQCWQKNLGVTVTLKGVSENGLGEALKAGGYDAACIPLGNAAQIARPLFLSFGSDSGDNIYRFSDADYDAILEQLKGRTEGEEAACLLQAETYLQENAYLLPLMTESRSLVTDQDIHGIGLVCIRGQIRFSSAVKDA